MQSVASVARKLTDLFVPAWCTGAVQIGVHSVHLACTVSLLHAFWFAMDHAVAKDDFEQPKVSSTLYLTAHVAGDLDSYNRGVEGCTVSYALLLCFVASAVRVC